MEPDSLADYALFYPEVIKEVEHEKAKLRSQLPQQSGNYGPQKWKPKYKAETRQTPIPRRSSTTTRGAPASVNADTSTSVTPSTLLAYAGHPQQQHQSRPVQAPVSYCDAHVSLLCSEVTAAGTPAHCHDSVFVGKTFRLVRTSCAVFPNMPCMSQTKR
ncbi:hypothetical protein INR49_024652 [Caranx melampygus]|nr:hypothetical protein INR49_024652 [Caranx melampygus]